MFLATALIGALPLLYIGTQHLGEHETIAAFYDEFFFKVAAYATLFSLAAAGIHWGTRAVTRAIAAKAAAVNWSPDKWFKRKPKPVVKGAPAPGDWRDNRSPANKIQPALVRGAGFAITAPGVRWGRGLPRLPGGGGCRCRLRLASAGGWGCRRGAGVATSRARARRPLHPPRKKL